MICKLGVGQLFVLVFQGMGLLRWFSGGLVQLQVHLPCTEAGLSVSGSRSHSVALFCSLQAFSSDGWNKYGCAQLSSPGAIRPCPQFSVKSSHTVISQFPTELYVYLICDWALLSQAPNWISKFQVLWTPEVWTQAVPPRGGIGSCQGSPFCWTPPGKWSHNCTAVEFMAIQSRKPVPRLAATLCLRTLPHLGTPVFLAMLGYPKTNSQTWDSIPAPEHLLVRDDPH